MNHLSRRLQSLFPPAITGSETHTNVSCFGENNGQITVFASGGTGLQYSIDGNAYQLSNVFNNLTQNTYFVTAKDVNGCLLDLGSVIITEPIEVTVSGIATNVTCFGASNGSIAVTNSIGSTVVITNSSNVDVTANNGSFNPDTYTLTATAPNGNDNGFCTAIASVTITEPAVLAATLASTNVTCNGANDGTITISGATGGYGTYEYSINGTTWQASG